LASHGWSHTRADRQTPEEFRADIRRTKHLLEDVGGQTVRGYRAATFSISHRNPWAFEILADEGYAYSSSVYPVRHDYYGMPSAPRFAFYPLPSTAFEEYPMTSVQVGGRNLPCSGGGYFRLLPYALSRWAIRRVNTLDAQPCVFYFHPWEIDADQPRMNHLPLKSRLRHYTNLRRMEGKVRRLFDDFAWDRIDRILLDNPAG
jgi:polysaccharide deacetylase family protein (PEP-CTERM system associated)